MPWPKGVPRSAETRAKISAGCLVALSDPDVRRRMSEKKRGEKNYFYGKTHTAETKAKLRAANVGKKLTPEHRAKVSRSLLGNQRALGNHFSLTPEQRAHLSQTKRGALNPGWKGGVTPSSHLIRGLIEYRVWRTSVFERDDYTCTECGARNGNGKAVILQAHHILSFADHHDQRFEIDNGLTLCLECHRAVHRGARDNAQYV